MRSMTLAFVCSALAVGCKFAELPLIDVDAAADAAPVDAAPVDAAVDATVDAAVDAPPQCAPNSILCDDANGFYIECSATGMVTRQFDCPLGCAPGQEKCLDIDPHNGWASYVDEVRDRNDLPSLTLSGQSRIQTTNGVVFNGGTEVAVPSYMADLNQVRVFLFKNLTINGTLEVPAGPALVLVVDGDIIIDGTLDVSADGVVDGPGVEPDTTCGGLTAFGAAPTPGGGGAGRYTAGGRGGADGGGEAGAMAGAQHFDNDLEPLRGGCSGGGGADLNNHFSAAGGAGGAIQIVSRSRILIVGQGKIDASGGGGGRGVGNDNLSGGGGGGSGGGILLEASEIVLDGADVVLSTKGGSGAASGGTPTSPGSDGGTAAGATIGGTATGQASGGSGGIGTTAPTNGGNATGANNGAGGGGAPGVAVLYTRSGAVNPQNGATIRSVFQIEMLRTRVVP